jgi:ADP-heptose:LPS heptosyltransferase
MKYVFKNKFYIFLISIIDFLGSFIFLPFRLLFRKKTPCNAGNILLIRLDHIGDVLYSLSVAENLKKNYPYAKITFLVGSWAKEAIINNPYIDIVICYDAPWFNRREKKIFDFRTFLKLAKELKKNRYDLGFDLRGDIRNILLMVLGRVKFRVGYGITGGGFLLHREVNHRRGAHINEHNLDLLRSINVNIISSEAEFYSVKEDEILAQNFLNEYNLKMNDFITAIHPFAGYPSKNWRSEKFAEIMNLLQKNYNAKIILVGSLTDKEKNENIIQLSQISAINAAGKTSLGSLAALFKKTNLFIGVDSGPSHIAAVTDTPSVVLYSGTNRLEEWAARGKRVIAIQKDTACKYCEKLSCNNNICMELISVEDVMNAVERVLKQ